MKKQKFYSNILNLKNKTILITGGTGSFGKRFLNTLLSYKPKRVVIFSRDEFKQYEMQKELKKTELQNCRFFWVM